MIPETDSFTPKKSRGLGYPREEIVLDITRLCNPVHPLCPDGYKVVRKFPDIKVLPHSGTHMDIEQLVPTTRMDWSSVGP